MVAVFFSRIICAKKQKNSKILKTCAAISRTLQFSLPREH